MGATVTALSELSANFADEVAQGSVAFASTMVRDPSGVGPRRAGQRRRRCRLSVHGSARACRRGLVKVGSPPGLSSCAHTHDRSPRQHRRVGGLDSGLRLCGPEGGRSLALPSTRRAPVRFPRIGLLPPTASARVRRAATQWHRQNRPFGVRAIAQQGPPNELLERSLVDHVRTSPSATARTAMLRSGGRASTWRTARSTSFPVHRSRSRSGTTRRFGRW